MTLICLRRGFTQGVAWSVHRSVCLSVCLSICLSVTIVSPARTAEPIDMPFGLWTPWAQLRKHVLDGGTHWRNLANTIEPSMCVGDAAFLSSPHLAALP